MSDECKGMATTLSRGLSLRVFRTTLLFSVWFTSLAYLLLLRSTLDQLHALFGWG